MIKRKISGIILPVILLVFTVVVGYGIFHLRTHAQKSSRFAKKSDPASRTFRMGFTSSPHDMSEEGFRQTFDFLKMNSDLIAHYFSEGIPWHEALHTKPYHQKIQHMLDFLASKKDDNRKVFLYMTPLNVHVDNVAGYWGIEKRSKWFPTDLKDPRLTLAYLNFCQNLIDRFKPDYLAYGIEVNALAARHPARWPMFLELAKTIYSSLKANNPQLPVFMSLNTNSFWENPERQTRIIQQILSYSDYLALSAYPYLSKPSAPSQLPKDYFSRIRSLAPNKPFVIAETGYPAQKGTLDSRIVRGNQPMQDHYLKFALQESQELNAEFLVWFVHRDYDPLVKKVVAAELSDEMVELFKMRKDTGLLDQNGRRRRALQTWTNWYHLPLKR
jgi:hypothetical protein